MRFTLAFACQLIAALALSTETRTGGGRVLYIQDNDPSGNSILSAKINHDGTLSAGVRTSTGGNGLDLLIVASQDSVLVSGNYLFTVNAGSNTLSMFAIDPRDPLHPRLVGKPAPTLGQIPVSVTYSDVLKTACVVNAGRGVVGVTCFSVDPVKGLSAAGPMRAIPQPGNADLPPPGIPPEILTGDIAFNPSSSGVFISLTNSTNQPGYLYAYPAVNGQISQTPIISSLKDIANPFSLNFLGSDSRLFVSNPHNESPGAALLDVSSLKATEDKIVTIPDQSASCWVAYSAEYDTLFVMDAALPTITTVNAALSKTTSQLNFTTPAFGATDSLVDRHYLYALTVPFNSNFSMLLASPQVLVYDIKPVRKGQNPKQIQSFDIFKAVGAGPELMGLAIYPSTR